MNGLSVEINVVFLALVAGATTATVALLLRQFRVDRKTWAARLAVPVAQAWSFLLGAGLGMVAVPEQARPWAYFIAVGLFGALSSQGVWTHAKRFVNGRT